MKHESLLVFAMVGVSLWTAAAVAAQTKVPANKLAKAPSQKGTAVQLSEVKTPLVFEPNQGQASKDYQWIGRGAGFRLGIGTNGATIEFRDRSIEPAQRPAILNLNQMTKKATTTKNGQSTQVKLHLSGTAGWKTSGVSPTGGISNYFIGNTPANWHTDIPQYAQVKAANVYPGIDLEFHGNEGTLEYDFIVSPGADPRQIQIQFEGGTSLQVDKASGDLVLKTANGEELRHAQPKIYQESGGKKMSVKGGFQVLKGDTAGFVVENYDAKKPLVIDPTISFVRFLGGSDTDQANAVTVDGLGNTYVTGTTYSGSFPVYGAIIDQNKSGDCDAFVTKLGVDGAIQFSTFLGGGDREYGYGIASDASGVYVVGQTWSNDFPKKQAMQGQDGDADAFVTKLSPVGNRLIYSTYLGGENGDAAFAIAVDATQAAYVGGFTTSQGFPRVLGSYDTDESNEGFTPRAFISKLSPAGTKLVYSTFLAGSVVDSISGIAIDSSLAAYVTGETCSPDFPYAGYEASHFIGKCEAFVTKLSPEGDSLVYSATLGEASVGDGIVVDAAGNAYIAGIYCGDCGDNSGNFAFAAKLLPSGKLSYLTYLNGSDGQSSGTGIGIDANGDAYVVGNTSSTTFPGAPPITPNPTAGFLVKLDKTGALLYTVFLGASINAVAVTQPKPHTVVTPTYPTIYTAGYRYTGGVASGHEDAFVVKLSESPVIVNQ